MTHDMNDLSMRRLVQVADRVLLRTGQDVLRKVLMLYFTAMSPHTPAWARTKIFGALAYLVSPIDAIPDALPGGYVDDIGVLVLALSAVAVHVTPAIRQQVDDVFANWGWDDAGYDT